METEAALLWGFVVLLLLVVGTIMGILVHGGLFTPVVVKTCKPDIGEVRIAYKFARGPYKESGALFTQIHTLLPEYRTVGVYYDDPRVKQPQKLRYIVGVILAEGPGATVAPEHRQLLEEHGYQFATFPAIDHAVQTSFPFSSTISIIMAVMKVYPAMCEYIEARSLCARPFLEVYDSKSAKIVFIGPLARQDDFYVPEVLQDEEHEHQDDYDDDARTENSSRSWDESTSFVREEEAGDGVSEGSETEDSSTHPPTRILLLPPPPPPPPSQLPLPLPSLPDESNSTPATTITTTTTTTTPATVPTIPVLPPPVPEVAEALDIADTGSAGSEESDANTASSFEEIDDREAAAAAAAAAAGVEMPQPVGGSEEGREGSVRKDDDEGER